MPPLGIAYIASYLRQYSYDVSILDCETMNYSLDEVREYCMTMKPSVVGITCLTSNLKVALKVASIAKMCGAVTVMGGSHITAYPDKTYPCVDYTIAGEGEVQMLALVRQLDN